MRYVQFYAVVMWVDPTIAETAQAKLSQNTPFKLYNLPNSKNNISFRIVSINLINIA